MDTLKPSGLKDWASYRPGDWVKAVPCCLDFYPTASSYFETSVILSCEGEVAPHLLPGVPQLSTAVPFFERFKSVFCNPSPAASSKEITMGEL